MTAELHQACLVLLGRDLGKWTDAIVVCRRHLSIEKGPPIDQVIEAGVVPAMIACLDIDDANMQFESAWCLTNVASGTTANVRYLVDQGILPKLMALLKSKSPEVVEQVVWCLANIAGDCAAHRDLVHSYGAMAACVALLPGAPHILALRNIAWCIANLCRGKPRPDPRLVLPAVKPLLGLLAKEKDEEVLVEALWAMSFISDEIEDTGTIQAIVDSGACRLLLHHLDSGNRKLWKLALRSLGNVCTGDDRQTQAVIDAGLIPSLRKLLETKMKPRECKEMQKEVMWTISNILAGTGPQIAAVAAGGLMEYVVRALESDSWDVKKEAVWCISNVVVGGSTEQVDLVQKAIEPLCAILACSDAKLLLVTLDSLERMLARGKKTVTKKIEECGGLDALENLQDHKNEDVYRKAVQLIATYFEGTED